MTGKSKTRLVRPIERQPMKEWLYENLENGEIPGLEWHNRDKLVFRVKWCHGSRHGWSVKDSVLFEEWAKHSGRWNNGDPKRWKANFRCALNSLRYVEEVKELSVKKGQYAFRVFRMLEFPKTPDTAKQLRRRSVFKEDADYGYSRCSIDSVAPVRTSPRVPKPTSSRFDDTASDIDTSLTEDEEELDSEGYQTDVQNETKWNGDEHYGIESSVMSLSSSSSEDTVTEYVTEETPTANIPNFDKIVPGLFKLEFGKMHYLPRHNSGFKVEMLKTQDPITPPILYSFTQPNIVPTSSSPFTSSFLSSASSPKSISSQTNSATKPLAGMIPEANVTSTISYVPTHEMNCLANQMLPTNVQHSCYHATFPETPEASVGSPDGNSEHLKEVEVAMYEEEVSECSPVSASNGVSSFSMTSTTMDQSQIHEFHSSSDSNQPVILIVKNGDIFPLTPP